MSHTADPIEDGGASPEPVILYVHDLRSSGVVRNAIDHAAMLARQRPTTLVAGYDTGLFRDEARAGPFAIHALGQEPGRAARLVAAVRLRRWLMRAGGAVLLSEGNLGHPTCYWATRGLPRLLRIYCISQEVNRGDGWRARSRRLWTAMLTRDAARLVLVGTANSCAPGFARALSSGRAVELPNAVDIDRARTLATASSPHPWLDEPVPVVLGIGRLRPQKNFDLLISGVGLARRTRRLRLIIIGGGAEAERARLAAQAAAAGLGEDVLLPGETHNVFAWLARAHVFALTSRWEGSAVTLLEALSIGTPVVASDRAGDARRVLDDGRHGRLFDGHDPSALAEALLGQISPEAIRPDDWQSDGSAELYGQLVDDVVRSRRGQR